MAFDGQLIKPLGIVEPIQGTLVGTLDGDGNLVFPQAGISFQDFVVPGTAAGDIPVSIVASSDHAAVAEAQRERRVGQ